MPVISSRGPRKRLQMMWWGGLPAGTGGRRTRPEEQPGHSSGSAGEGWETALAGSGKAGCGRQQELENLRLLAAFCLWLISTCLWDM